MFQFTNSSRVLTFSFRSDQLAPVGEGDQLGMKMINTPENEGLPARTNTYVYADTQNVYAEQNKTRLDPTRPYTSAPQSDLVDDVSVHTVESDGRLMSTFRRQQ